MPQTYSAAGTAKPRPRPAEGPRAHSAGAPFHAPTPCGIEHRRQPRRRAGPAGGRRAGGATRPLVESVESRVMMSVSTDANGWTVVAAPSDAHDVFVSSSTGNDSNTGLSPSAPVKTLAKAKLLVRGNSGDELLLKRGDTWHESFGTWTKSGRSADQPLVIGAYGSGDRPVVATGKSSAFTTGLTSAPAVNHVYLMGIRFYADTRDPASSTYAGPAGNEGIRFTAGTNDFLIEDCAVDGYTMNVDLYRVFGPITNVRIRRSIIVDSYSTTTHAEGIFAYGVDGLTLDGNVLDHNGWNSAVSGGQATMFNHDAYIKENVTGFVATGNLFADASSHGLQARGGGDIERNVFLNDPIGMSFGLVNGAGGVKPGGVTGTIRGNVFLGSATINGSARGWGIEMSNIAAGGHTEVSGNVFAGSPAGSGYAINLSYGTPSNPAQAVGINDLTIDDNVVYNWTKGLYINPALVPGGSGPTALNGLVVRGNDFQRLQSTTTLAVGSNFKTSAETLAGNTYNSSAGSPVVSVSGSLKAWATWSPGKEAGSSVAAVSYPDPSRTAATYAAVVKVGTTVAAYINAARSLSRTAWQSALTPSALGAYVRAGLGL